MRLALKSIVIAVLALLGYRFGMPGLSQAYHAKLHALDAPPREMAVQRAVYQRIKQDICPQQEGCVYASRAWGPIGSWDPGTYTVEHRFTTDGVARRFLFRVRGDEVVEIVNMD